MAEEISELLVKIRPDGAAETREELEGVSDQFEESADVTGDAAGELGAFSRKFKGAALVLVAGLATLTAGILSNVPVLKESASAIAALMTVLGLEIDKVVRGPISAFNRQIFRTAARIAKADTALGKFKELVVGIGSALLLAFITWIDPVNKRLLALADNAIPRLKSAFEGFKSFIDGIDVFAGLRQRIVGIIIKINDVIRAFNRIPGGPNAGFVDIPTPPQGSVPDVPETGGGEDMGVQGGGSSIATGTVETTINIDSSKVGEAVKPFLVRGTLSKRGLPGE